MGGKTLTRADLGRGGRRKGRPAAQRKSGSGRAGAGGDFGQPRGGTAVKLSSFGSFGIRQKGQRIGRNPKTGEEVPITPRRVLVFRPSNIMKDRINKGHGKRRPD